MAIFGKSGVSETILMRNMILADLNAWNPSTANNAPLSFSSLISILRNLWPKNWSSRNDDITSPSCPISWRTKSPAVIAATMLRRGNGFGPRIDAAGLCQRPRARSNMANTTNTATTPKTSVHVALRISITLFPHLAFII
jgi:hypothetical protein